MTDQQKRQILKLKADGLTFATISNKIGLPEGTIKSFCSRNKDKPLPTLPPDYIGNCEYCGNPITLEPGTRSRRFCDRSCYIRWWHAQGNHKCTVYHKVCAHCGKPFSVPIKKAQKYCSIACFHDARREAGNV